MGEEEVVVVVRRFQISPGRNFFQVPFFTPIKGIPQHFSKFSTSRFLGGGGDARISDLPPGYIFKGQGEGSVKTWNISKLSSCPILGFETSPGMNTLTFHRELSPFSEFVNLILSDYSKN